MEEKIELLKKKVTSSGIEFKEVIPENPELSSRITFDIPAGREKYQCIIIYRDERLDEALSLNFEKYRFINSIEAIWSNELKIIEAEVTSNESFGRMYFDRLYKLICKPERNEDDDTEIEISNNIPLPGIDDLTISIGYCSPDFAFLSSVKERGGSRGMNSKRITLKISNSKTQTHDTSKEILEKIANSIFFQIDLNFEIALNLQSQRESILERHNKRIRKQKSIDVSATLKEPKYEYDTEPISLYWYAKESANMPIFQFLAYYQSLEFYFPIYSSFEAKQKIQSLIKDPRFNPNKDSDISKIISTVKVSSYGKSFGSEREQLKSTLTACTNNNELQEFFKLDDKRFDFYAENKGKSIAKQKISVKNETSDFLSEVSERIYEIRCRIVHSKASEGNFDVLLPYSSEVKQLNFDIELIEFLSRRILITSSRALKL